MMNQQTKIVQQEEQVVVVGGSGDEETKNEFMKCYETRLEHYQIANLLYRYANNHCVTTTTTTNIAGCSSNDNDDDNLNHQQPNDSMEQQQQHRRINVPDLVSSSSLLSSSSSNDTTSNHHHQQQVPVLRLINKNNSNNNNNTTNFDNSTVHDVGLVVDTSTGSSYNNSSSSSSSFYLRTLYPTTEIRTLQKNGCTSTDWSKIFLLLPNNNNNNNKNDNINHVDEDDKKNENNNNNNNNECDDNQSNLLNQLVSNTKFDGIIIFVFLPPPSSPSSDASLSLSSTTTTSSFHDYGIHNCTCVRNSIISIPTCSIRQCELIEYCYFESNCSIVQNGILTATNTSNNSSQQHDHHPKDDENNESLFYNDMKIIVGPETNGGYELHITPECTMMDIGNQILHYPMIPKKKKKLDNTPHHDDDDDNHDTTTSKWIFFSFFSIGTNVSNNYSITNVYLYEYTKIVACYQIDHLVWFPFSTIENGCTVSYTYGQWNCSIQNNSIVHNTMCCECTSIGPNSHVTHTIFGCDVHVSNGEIHHSICGNQCNSHHQSIFIASIILAGRVNIGYGTNMGSNHTGRIPDQLHTSSEGIFYGLNCSGIYPIDLSYAYYSLIGANTQLVSGRCTMPFSLLVQNNVTTTSTTTSRHNNNNNNVNVVPGWVLRSSPYTLERNEMKYTSRQCAKYHDMYYTTPIATTIMKKNTSPILRIQTIHQCYLARIELQYRINNNHNIIQTSQQKEQPNGVSWLPRSPPTTTTTTILKAIDPKRYEWNSTTYHISIESCQKGIQTYTDCIQRYALTGLYEQVHTVLLVANYQAPSSYKFNNNTNNDDESTTDVLPSRNDNLQSELIHLLFKPVQMNDVLNVKVFQKLQPHGLRSTNTGITDDTTDGDNDDSNGDDDDKLPNWPPLPWDIDLNDSQIIWEYQRWLLQTEYISPSVLKKVSLQQPIRHAKNVDHTDIIEMVHQLYISLFDRYVQLLEQHTRCVYQCKERDDQRGIRTIPRYSISNKIVMGQQQQQPQSDPNNNNNTEEEEVNSNDSVIQQTRIHLRTVTDTVQQKIKPLLKSIFISSSS